MGNNWDIWEPETGEEYELKCTIKTEDRERYSQEAERKRKDNTCISVSEKKEPEHGCRLLLRTSIRFVSWTHPEHRRLCHLSRGQVCNLGLKQERTRGGTAKIYWSFFMLEQAILAKLKPNKTDVIDQLPKRRSMLQEWGVTEPGCV